MELHARTGLRRRGGDPSVHTEQFVDLDAVPGLLECLAHDGIARILTMLDATTRQRPQLLEGISRIDPARKQKPAVSLAHRT